jgi:hypothetical protein
VPARGVRRSMGRFGRRSQPDMRRGAGRQAPPARNKARSAAGPAPVRPRGRALW